MAGGEHSTDRSSRWRVAQYALTGSACSFVIVGLGLRLHVNFATTAFLHLLLVLSIATFAGFWEATVTSVAAFICLNYFFVPPLYTLYVADPQNWVALVTFESTALLVSRLSNQREKEARAAVLERMRMVKLYELSRRILLMDLQREPGPQLVEDIRQVMEVESVAVFDASVSQVDSAGPDGSELSQLAIATCQCDRDEDNASDLTWHRVLRPGNSCIGAVVLRGGNTSSLLADSTAALIAIALERIRSLEKRNRAEAAKQSEQLRTMVLDALAHAYKTPLTAIRAASSGLLEWDDLSSGQRQLLTLIEEESSKLSSLTTRLLRAAKLDASEIKLYKEPVVIPELIKEILAAKADQLLSHPASLSFSSPYCAADGDPELLATAIMQLIENAAKYSAPGTPIAIRVDDGEGQVVISVHNEGSEVSPEDRDRIFDRFYRSPGSDHVAEGTGLGLSITKQTAEAHQGRVWVAGEKGKGTTFFLSLPSRSIDPGESLERGVG